MDIVSCFLSCLTSSPKLSSSQKPEDFLGCIFEKTDFSIPYISQLLSGGTIHATFPWSFDIDNLNCFLLLYTKSGCGKLLVDNQVYTLAPSTLLFLDCSCRFRIDLAMQPWDYQVVFIKGDVLSSYYQLLPYDKPLIIKASEPSSSAMNMARLVEARADESLCSVLVISDLINHMITDMLTTLLKENTPTVPISPFLKAIRKQFDQNYRNTFSLDELASQYHISKYRLCREFNYAFGCSPIQYLNKRRIEIASHLLLTTDLRIHQVGSEVGIDNTNHFIHLFKKFVGYTPYEYKQRMLS